MYVVGAAFAMTQAADPGGMCRHGRCILESDGTLDIKRSNDTSKDTTAGTAKSSPFMNMTQLETHQLVDAFSNSNAILQLKNLTNNSSSLSEHVPEPQLDSAGQIMLDPESSRLNCPCNCTYVSAACCLSKAVWEDRSLQVHMAAPSANLTVACDESTGTWLHNTTGL